MSERPTPAEAERLEMLIEACADVVKAATKVLRSGYAETVPLMPPHRATNRHRLENVLADVHCAVVLMARAGDVDPNDIADEADSKASILPVRLRRQ